MKALITGGAGFIGSHLADELIKRGDTVCAVDNISTGSESNIQHLKENKNFSFVKGSVLNKSLMNKLIQDVDIVYHLAAAVGVKYIMENPIKSIHTNVYGTDTILKIANKWKKKVLITSTSEVYGKNGDMPYKEDGDRLMGPTKTLRWSYACTKALDEFMSLAYFMECNLPVVIVRLFNTCGPRQTGRYGMVIPRFIKAALSNKPIEVYGDGTQSRCFTYVGDAVKAIIKLMETEKAYGDIFNIGGNHEVQIRDLAKRIIELTGSRSEIKYIPYEKVYSKGFEDMKRRIPDISKIRDLIGWQPEVDLDQLLKIVINYEKSVLGL